MGVSLTYLHERTSLQCRWWCWLDQWLVCCGEFNIWSKVQLNKSTAGEVERFAVCWPCSKNIHVKTTLNSFTGNNCIGKLIACCCEGKHQLMFIKRGQDFEWSLSGRLVNSHNLIISGYAMSFGDFCFSSTGITVWKSTLNDTGDGTVAQR